MQQTFEIYKYDKWNMMFVEQQGTRYHVREISTEWGEDSQTFLTRHALMQFAEQRFATVAFVGEEAERQRILAVFREICQ